MSDIGFAPNYTHLYEIDITPNAATQTMVRMAAGIKTVSPDPTENVTEDEYYDGDGLGSADVMGSKWKVSFSGDRRYGDAAQDYIASLKMSFGEARRTTLRITNPDGEIMEGTATIANIKTFGGDANNKPEFSCDIYFNGLPKITSPTADSLPESVTASDVTVAVSKTVTVAAAVTPDTASARCAYAIDNVDIATVDDNGVVTGVSAGETQLTVKCVAKPSIQTTINVTVTATSTQSSK